MSSTPKKSVKLEQKPTPTRIEFIYLASVASPKRPAFAADHLTQSRYANGCQENPDIRFGGRPCLVRGCSVTRPGLRACAQH